MQHYINGQPATFLKTKNGYRVKTLGSESVFPRTNSKNVVTPAAKAAAVKAALIANPGAEIRVHDHKIEIRRSVERPATLAEVLSYKKALEREAESDFKRKLSGRKNDQRYLARAKRDVEFYTRRVESPMPERSAKHKALLLEIEQLKQEMKKAEKKPSGKPASPTTPDTASIPNAVSNQA